MSYMQVIRTGLEEGLRCLKHNTTMSLRMAALKVATVVAERDAAKQPQLASATAELLHQYCNGSDAVDIENDNNIKYDP